MVALALAAAYLVGSIPVGVIVCRLWKGVDPREHGSGNIGATNVYRLLGPGPGILVGLLDAGKGAAAVLICCALAGQVDHAWIGVGGAVAGILGSNRSIFLGFQGGKGGMVSLGAGLALVPVVGLLSFAVWLVVLALTRYVSVASMAGGIACLLLAYLFHSPQAYQVMCLFIAVSLVVRHRANIERLRKGTEPKVGRKKTAG
ncbi:MAG TPA: glycerol-3-phosphate 1-O-acyltransferase PlsY [Armatimonadota bacterium]|jgi:glycerol-3-phosphate acyltransferase PlsY